MADYRLREMGKWKIFREAFIASLLLCKKLLIYF